MKTHFHPLCVMWAKRGIIHENGVLILEELNSKVLYSASRPKKFRNFMLTTEFLNLWAKNKEIFRNEPPEIGLVYIEMPKEKDGISHVIPIALSDPKEQEKNCWQFDLTKPQALKKGSYQEVALFIDWLPSERCPGPIAAIFPKFC